MEKLMAALRPETLVPTVHSLTDLLDGVRAGADRIYELVEREPEVLRLLLVEASAVDDELTQRLLGLEAMVAVWVAGELRRGVDDGWLRRDLDVDVLAHTILMMVMPGVVKELRGVGNPKARKHTTEMALLMLEKALRVRAVSA
ncbi:hypothetical protein [Nocardia sp. NPDC050406]|uniref:hypothetical protein n=1 Tax=Nocardia sp. NPDC050406 TaxID=3364318 RepID=UPI00379F88BA